MDRYHKSVPLKTLPIDFKTKLWCWAQQFNPIQWLDSNQYNNRHSSFETLLAIGQISNIKTNYQHAFKKLQQYIDQTQDYIFGYLGYDLKNDIENLSSQNEDYLGFPDLLFFQAEKIFIIKQNNLELYYPHNIKNQWKDDIDTISNFRLHNTKHKDLFKICQRTSKAEYKKQFSNLQEYLKKGDTYETNYCIEFFANNVSLYPYELYETLNKISPMPFAGFIKYNQYNIISASPERFIKKNNHEILTQPIKGTRKRGNNTKEDKLLINDLATSSKEQSENIMIVDLVRNDLSKVASKGSVNVEELCKIYTYPSVHQMESTVTAKIKPETNTTDIIKALFPMGSMTGAPKISTMKIIEHLEDHKRGVYSGGIGYITPDGDFDFNVVIRTMLYNTSKKYLSFSVGGAITSCSEVGSEYEECLTKAQPIINTLKLFSK